MNEITRRIVAVDDAAIMKQGPGRPMYILYGSERRVRHPDRLFIGTCIALQLHPVGSYHPFCDPCIDRGDDCVAAVSDTMPWAA